MLTKFYRPILSNGISSSSLIGFRTLSISNIFFQNPITSETKIPSDSVYADYGYVITVHKAQGSEWTKVCVIDEPNIHWNMNKWRYTAITRASEKLNFCI